MSTYVFLDENNKLTHSTNTTLNAPNIEISQGSITSDHGTINFNDEHLTTTGNITGNSLVIDANGGISSSDLINLNSITKLNYVNSTLGGVLKLIKGSGGQSNNYDYEILNDYVATNHNNTASAGFRIRSLAPTIDKAFFGHNVTYGNCCILNPDNNTNFVFKQNSLHISNSTNSTLSFNYDSGDFAHNIADTKKHIFQINNTDILTINQTGYHLDVTGNINFTGNITKDGDALISSLWTEDNSNNIYYNNGNVGIGNNNPTEKLDVNGTTKTTVLDVNSALKIDYDNTYLDFTLTNYSSPFMKLHNNGTTLNFAVSTFATDASSNITFNISGSGQDVRFQGDKAIINYDLDVDGNIYGQNLYTNNNIYSNGALALRSASGSGMNFYTNNLSTARMSIDTNGYVGINTSPSSSYQLDVNGGIRGSSVRTYHYYYSDSHMYFKPNSGYNMYFETNNSTRMTIDTSGYVGINTSPSSSYQLAVNGAIRGSSMRTQYYYYSDYSMYFKPNSGYSMYFETNNSTRMTIDTSGYVGINTAPNSSYRLDVNGISRHKGKVIISPDSSSECTCQFDSTNQRISTWANTMWFVMQGSNRMVINSSGNVGIGTTSPTEKLEVNGALRISGYTSTAGNNLSGNQDDGTCISTYWYKPYSNSYWQEFAGNSSGSPYWDLWGTDYDPGNINSTGCSCVMEYALFMKNGSIFLACDRRLKQNITPIDDNYALDIINKIDMYKFKYKDCFNYNEEFTYNVIAQEVSEVFPQAVNYHTDFLPDIMAGVNPEFRERKDKKYDMIITPNEKWEKDYIKKGKTYRFYIGENDTDFTNNKHKVIDLICSEKNTFITEEKYKYILFYGVEVNDLMSVDKQKIYALHHSAIQQLHKNYIKQQEEINTLKTELDNIKELLLKNNII